jgi:hypothetical protein
MPFLIWDKLPPRLPGPPKPCNLGFMTGKARFVAGVARWLRWLGAALTLLLALGGVALVIWARQLSPADPAAAAALSNSDAVTVQRDEWIVFQPRAIDASTGMIFYPGGKADPTAYAPILSRIAAAGYLVVLTPMPLNLAILAPDRAARVIGRYPAIKRWAIAGHSLGGVLACAFASEYREQLAGLVLWASYPAPMDDLSGAALPTLSIYATRDELTRPDDIEQSRARLPVATTYVEIKGGDHWNFGHFAIDRSTAGISREEQQTIVLDATLAFLRKVAPLPAPSTTM